MAFERSVVITRSLKRQTNEHFHHHDIVCDMSEGVSHKGSWEWTETDNRLGLVDVNHNVDIYIAYHEKLTHAEGYYVHPQMIDTRVDTTERVYARTGNDLSHLIRGHDSHMRGKIKFQTYGCSIHVSSELCNQVFFFREPIRDALCKHEDLRYLRGYIERMLFGLYVPTTYMIDDKVDVSREDESVDKWEFKPRGQGSQFYVKLEMINASHPLLQIKEALLEEDWDVKRTLDAIILYGSKYDEDDGVAHDVKYTGMIHSLTEAKAFLKMLHGYVLDPKTHEKAIRKNKFSNLRAAPVFSGTPQTNTFLGWMKNYLSELNLSWEHFLPTGRAWLTSEDKRRGYSADAYLTWMAKEIVNQIELKIKAGRLSRISKFILAMLREGTSTFIARLSVIYMVMRDLFGACPEVAPRGSIVNAVVLIMRMMVPNLDDLVKKFYGDGVGCFQQKRVVVFRRVPRELPRERRRGVAFEFKRIKRPMSLIPKSLFRDMNAFYQRVVDQGWVSKQGADDFFNDAPVHRSPIASRYPRDVAPYIRDEEYIVSDRFLTYAYRYRLINYHRFQDDTYREKRAQSRNEQGVAKGLNAVILGWIPHTFEYEHRSLLRGEARGEAKLKEDPLYREEMESVFEHGCYTGKNLSYWCGPGRISATNSGLLFDMLSRTFHRPEEDGVLMDFSDESFYRLETSSLMSLTAVVYNIWAKCYGGVPKSDEDAVDWMEAYCKGDRLSMLELSFPYFHRDARTWRDLWLSNSLILAGMADDVITLTSQRFFPLWVCGDDKMHLISVDITGGELNTRLWGWLPYLEKYAQGGYWDTEVSSPDDKLFTRCMEYYSKVSLSIRKEDARAHKVHLLDTWMGAQCGGVADSCVVLDPMRLPSPTSVVYCISSCESDRALREKIIRSMLPYMSTSGLGVISIIPSSKICDCVTCGSACPHVDVENESAMRVRKLPGVSMLDAFNTVLISSKTSTFGNTHMLLKILNK
ncbi:VP2 [Lebombo virus]|uniref:Outer capsid protein VP2 n=1 Tax=Lebombo virus TaxID=40057 RepID=W5QLZ0_9REOV|nr:VP2 [Lebombo virus]AFX73378.1 VP2 [Lebombo virus]